jgi:hypothetical protein
VAGCVDVLKAPFMSLADLKASFIAVDLPALDWPPALGRLDRPVELHHRQPAAGRGDGGPVPFLALFEGRDELVGYTQPWYSVRDVGQPGREAWEDNPGRRTFQPDGG